MVGSVWGRGAPCSAVSQARWAAFKSSRPSSGHGRGYSSLSKVDSCGTNADERNAPLWAQALPPLSTPLTRLPSWKLLPPGPLPQLSEGPCHPVPPPHLRLKSYGISWPGGCCPRVLGPWDLSSPVCDIGLSVLPSSQGCVRAGPEAAWAGASPRGPASPKAARAFFPRGARPSPTSPAWSWPQAFVQEI